MNRYDNMSVVKKSHIFVPLKNVQSFFYVFLNFITQTLNVIIFYCAGKEEALAAGKAVKEAGLKFDVAHTSLLTRAQNTLNSILQESGQTGIPISKTWRLVRTQHIIQEHQFV